MSFISPCEHRQTIQIFELAINFVLLIEAFDLTPQKRKVFLRATDCQDIVDKKEQYRTKNVLIHAEIFAMHVIQTYS